MAINVKFLKGTSAEYNSIGYSLKDPNTFYYTSDDSQLYLGNIKLSNANDLAAAVTNIAQNANDIINIQQQLQSLIGDGTGSIANMIDDAIAPILRQIGPLDNLQTEVNNTLVGAINEVLEKAGNVSEAGKVSIKTTTNTEESFVTKRYSIYQGDSNIPSNKIGDIDIPSDMVVQSGEVITNPVGQPAGTYIVLTLQNAEHDKIYVNVGSLVDLYNAEQNAAEIQLTIDNKSPDRLVSAVIVNESIKSNKLAPNSVTTPKIVDKNVTKSKLDDDVQNSLNKADSAIQTIEAGPENGTINVDGAKVTIPGLQSGAWATVEELTAPAYEAQQNLSTYIGENNIKVNSNTAAINEINNENTGILAQAKSYADMTDNTRDEETLKKANAYADGLGVNYATAEQGKKADTALQKDDIVEGNISRAILVDDKTVYVHGLGTAAEKNIEHFDLAGTAKTEADNALVQAKTYVNEALTWGSII